MYLQILSSFVGWVYFIAWSVSFYPQLYLNYQRKSVHGLSFEFLLYNFTGFLFYSLFNIFTFVWENKHHLRGSNASVQPNDIAFALHALLLTIITIAQCFYYERRGQDIIRGHLLLCLGIWLVALLVLSLAIGGVISFIDTDSTYSFTFIEFLGYCKLFISFIKYLPQLFLNYQRKSTVGWSIGNILLDLTGGLGSFLQQMLDSIISNSTFVFTSNLPKLCLALISVCFDILFIVQHYVLYPEPRFRYIEYPLSISGDSFSIDDDETSVDDERSVDD